MYELSDIFFDNLWNRQKKARSECAFSAASCLWFAQLKSFWLVAETHRVSKISRRCKKFHGAAV